MVVKDEGAVAYRKTKITYPWRGLKINTMSVNELWVAHPGWLIRENLETRRGNDKFYRSTLYT